MPSNLRLRSLLVMGASAAALTAITSPAAAQSASGSNVIEELVVTANRREQSLQDVPVAVSAFSDEALKAQRLDGGGNLVLSIPNVNFSRGNFGGYSFAIRGIGSKVVGAGGTAGVSFHENNSPLSGNRLADAEFYDVERVEVLRGPQGTLYGRNASGGVINVLTAKPTDDFSASITGELGSYDTRRVKGFVNLPLGDLAALRVAGTYLKRDGFGDNTFTGNDINDRDLSSMRATLSFEPTDYFRGYMMWEHFNEKDHRSRVGKQLCIKDPGKVTFGGNPVAASNQGMLGQGCLGGSLYQDAAYGATNAASTLAGIFAGLTGLTGSPTDMGDVFQGIVQDKNLYNISTPFDPVYEGRQDFVQAQLQMDLGEEFTVTALGSYNRGHGFSLEDYNRIAAVVPFNTTPNPINGLAAVPGYASIYASLFPGGVVNDPQLGRSNYLTTIDRGVANGREWTGELRLESHFDGPLNFSLGGIHIDNRNLGSDYYVISNGLTSFTQINNTLGGALLGGIAYIDPNPDPQRDGRNYYDSTSLSHLRSRAVFGEVYYELNEQLRATAGVRFTKDTLRVTNFPILLQSASLGGRGFGTGTQQRDVTHAMTGRVNLEWSPELSFTNQTLIYGSFSRGYKGGGFNTPCDATAVTCATLASFEPEYINAYEVGTKNTMLDGSLVLNLTGFYYDYKGYQISQIINKSSTNVNVDAKIYGLELESIWEPVHNLRFNANAGYLHTEIVGGSSIDTLYRTQGNPNLIVVKDTGGGNCVVNGAGLTAAIVGTPFSLRNACNGLLAAASPALYDYSSFPGINTAPVTTPGGVVQVGQGIPVSLDGKDLPNSPKYTVSLGAQYKWQMDAWEVTLRGDYYKQGKSFGRIYNTVADQLKSWDNVNATLTVNNEDMGVNVQLYVKNLMDDSPLTDIYLTDDSSGLFTNVFVLDPREYGISITKSF